MLKVGSSQLINYNIQQVRQKLPTMGLVLVLLLRQKQALGKVIPGTWTRITTIIPTTLIVWKLGIILSWGTSGVKDNFVSWITCITPTVTFYRSIGNK
jgi:hypothetical protein